MIRDEGKLAALLADVRHFVRDVAIPNEARTERDRAVPTEVVAEMRRRGYFGWSIPKEFGGAELTTEELALANIEISQCSVAFRVRVAVNTGVGAEPLVQAGSTELKREWLPRFASGDLTAVLALTEEAAGSDATAIQTTGRAESDGWYVLNGHKRYITLAPIADVFTILARTEEASRKTDGITAFLVPRGTEGFSTSAETPMMGQEGAPIGEVFLKECRIHERNIIGPVGTGFHTLMKTLNKQRINLAALAIGPAIRMLDEAIKYASTRVQSGRPIGGFQLVQALLAECKVDIECARALVLETARKRDEGHDVTMDVSICKYFATEMCGRVADRVVQIFGGQGYLKERSIERFYRDVRAFRIYEGTSQVHQLNIARLLLKEWGSSLAMSGPLQGLRILDLATIIAGPFASTLLADYGADVLKVELPSIGDGARNFGPFRDGKSLWWKAINRNKKFMTLDLRKEEGLAIVKRLLSQFDVVVENFRPGTLDRWGLTKEAMWEINPRLVILRTTGFGQSGPYRDRPGFARVFEALSGIVYITGEPEGPPLHPGAPIGDEIGGLFGALGILAACWKRAKDPEAKGEEIDLSLCEASLRILDFLPIEYEQTGVVRERSGNRNQYSAPSSVFRTRDGHWVSLSGSTNAIFANNCRAIGREDLVSDPRFLHNKGRVGHSAELNQIFSDWVLERDLKSVLQCFAEAEGTLAPIYSVDQIFADPHFIARDAITRVPDADFGKRSDAERCASLYE